MNLIDYIDSEMGNDDEDRDDQSEQLERVYLEASDEAKAVLDKAFICLCGWSLTNLVGK